MRDEEPNWQPVGALPMMTARVAEGVRLAREHLELLWRAHPYQLDDPTVSRVIATWQVTRDDLDHLFAEQGRRWRDLTRGTAHQHDVERYCARAGQARRASAVSIADLADVMPPDTEPAARWLSRPDSDTS